MVLSVAAVARRSPCLPDFLRFASPTCQRGEGAVGRAAFGAKGAWTGPTT